jgi:predicted methyltransferase
VVVLFAFYSIELCKQHFRFSRPGNSFLRFVGNTRRRSGGSDISWAVDSDQVFDGFVSAGAGAKSKDALSGDEDVLINLV